MPYTEIYEQFANANTFLTKIENGQITWDTTLIGDGMYHAGEFWDISYSGGGIFTWTAKKNIKVWMMDGQLNSTVTTYTTGQTITNYYSTGRIMIVQEA